MGLDLKIERIKNLYQQKKKTVFQVEGKQEKETDYRNNLRLWDYVVIMSYLYFPLYEEQGLCITGAQ